MKAPIPLVLALTATAATAGADDWPQWRGPHGTGVSMDEGFPTRWNRDEIAWKARLGGLGISSPIVVGDRVFVTSQVGRSTLKPGNHPTLARGEEAQAEKPLGAGSTAQAPAGGVEFLIEAFDRKDGRRLWQHRLPAEGDLPEVHQKHNLASPSPVTDGRVVMAWFGNGQLLALDLEGKLLWQRHLGRELAPFLINWGHGSSPILYEDLVILLCDHDPGSYLLALDKRTGKERWKVARPKGSISYSTPTVVRGPRGPEMIVNSTTRIDAYDPRTGELLWWTGENHRFAVPVPTYHDGVLYMSRGYRSGPYLAVAVGGRGDVSKTHVRWSVPTGAPYIASLLHYEGLVFMANDAGIVTCVDPATGEKIWQERIEGIFTASPVGAEGRIYLVSEPGETIVLQAGREPRLLARNVLGERSAATPALSAGQIFIRTDDHLICVGAPTQERAATVALGFAGATTAEERAYVRPSLPSGGGPPFSGAVKVGNTLYLSGDIGLTEEQKVPDDPKAEARLLLERFKRTLAEAGFTMDDLVYVTVHCSDVKHYADWNEVYRGYFKKEFPARAFIGSGRLLFDARFEMQGIAAKR